MKIILCLAVAAVVSTLVVSSSVGGQDRSVAAVQKVIQMLTDMQATAKQELNDEQIHYAKFETWCEMESAALHKEIKEDAEEMEMLSANIGKLTSEAKTLGEEIAKLTSDVATAEADMKAAKAQREKDHAAYLEGSQDYGESVDALERAITALSKEDYDRTGSDALTQLAAARLPAKAKSMVAAFLGMSDDGDESAEEGADMMAIAPPEANAYEFQSGGVIGMLKRLRDEFREKKAETEKEEMNSKHAFEMRVQDLTDLMENGAKDIEEKKELKALKESNAADDKKQLAATAACKAEDEKTLAAMQAECSEKSQSFKEKQQLRTDEIEAIQQAIEILSGEAVTGNAEKHLNLIQTGAGWSLSQLTRRQLRSSQVSVHQHIREFIESEGRRLHSKGLALLAEKLAADPFSKVKKLIDNMITRLLEEANEDAEHEGWCDKEMGESKITRAKLTEEIDGLDAVIEQGKANIISLAEDINLLTQEVAEIDAAVAKATEMRTEEKAKNTVTIEDAIEAKTAVEAATAVLKEFYAKALYATGFLQMQSKTSPHNSMLARGIKMGTEEWKAVGNPAYDTGGGTMTMDDLSTATTGVDKGHKEGMQTFGKTFQGQQDEAGGVIALLETILSDFAALEADTKAAETESQRAYEEFMTASKKSRAVKSKKIEMNTADKAAAEKKLQDDIADLKATQDELLAADRYHAKLVPQCIDQGMTWDERVKAREDEIASLKQALEILGSADIATSA